MYFLTMYVYIHWMSFMIDKTLITTIVLMFEMLILNDDEISLILNISMQKNIIKLFFVLYLYGYQRQSCRHFTRAVYNAFSENFQTKNKLIVTKDKQRPNFSGTLDVLFCRFIKTCFISYRFVIQCQNFVQTIQFVPKSFLFFNNIVS